MSEYIVQRDSSYSGSSNENIQKRSIAEVNFLYAARKNLPLVYGLGGNVPNAKTGKWEKVKGAFRTADKHVKKHEWYSEDLITFELNGGTSETAIATTGTSFDLAAAADYNKLRLGETVRVRDTGDSFLVTALGTSPAVTLKSSMGAAATIPANATLVIKGRAVKEGSSAGSERDSMADNFYNLMQIVREDASITRSEEKLLMEQNGASWDPKGRRKAKSMHVFNRYLDNQLTFGERLETTDANSKAVRIMGGLTYYATHNILAANTSDSSTEFSGISHGGTLSFDEFIEYCRILSTQYDKGDTAVLLGGNIWDKCFEKWARSYPGSHFTFNTSTDEFGFAITKIKTPYLKMQHIGSGTVEENDPTLGIIIDPSLIRVLFHERVKYTEVNLINTANRTDAVGWTWLAEATLEVLGAKRFGQLKGVTGVEV